MELIARLIAKIQSLGIKDPELDALIAELQNAGNEGGPGEVEMEMPSKEDMVKKGFEEEAKRHMPGFKLEE